MNKICRKARKERTFWLFNDMLVYGAPVIGGKFIVSEHLLIDKMKINDVTDDGKNIEKTNCLLLKIDFYKFFDSVNKNILNALKISTDKKTFVVIAESSTAKKEWMESLEQTIENYKNRRKTFGHQTDKGDEFVAPEWITDEESDNCMSCTIKFTFFNRRHHCRNCGKLVCSTCSSNKMKIQAISVNPVRVCKECFTFNK